MNKKEIVSKYNKFAKYYDLSEVALEVLISKYRKRLLKNVYGKALEIGIGTGRNLKYYPQDINLTGIDISKEMLFRARRRAKKKGIEARLLIADSQNLPFEKKKFDFVIDTLGLCTYLNPIRVLMEMKRVCKKNGMILLLEHGVSNRGFFRRWQFRHEKGHYQRLGCSLVRDPEEIARKAGLRIEKIDRRLFGFIYIIRAKT